MVIFFGNVRLGSMYIFIPSPTKLRGDIVMLPSVRHNPCEHSRINILQWILTKLGTYLVLKRIWNPIDFQVHRSAVKVTVKIFTAQHPYEHSRINILQWVLTTLGTYTQSLGESGTLLIFQVIDQRSMSLGQIFTV